MIATNTKSFDDRRLLKQPGMFQPFEVTGSGEPLKNAGLSAATELLVFERAGEPRALLHREMVYHHLAQGYLGGEPYIISFCGVCNSGVGLTPIVDGKTFHFRAGGLYNGVVILTDDETGTYWDHITGAAVYGPLAGKQLENWGIAMTTVGAALEQEPEMILLRSHQQQMTSWLMERLQWLFGKANFLPKFFLQTMGQTDDRLPKMAMGVGVVIDGEARFYTKTAIGEGIADDWNGQTLYLRFGGSDRIPYAAWNDGTRPFQLYLRWYGFSLTFANCSVYGLAS